MKKKIENIQALRGTAVLMVVVYHIWSFEKNFWDSDKILPDVLKFGHIGVDLFFVISGFVIVTVTKGLFSQSGAIKTFLIKRITRIYPLYWLYTFLLVISYCILGTDFGNFSTDFKAFLLLPQGKLPVLNVAWSLINEMHFYFVFAFLMFFNEKYLIKLLAIWSVFIIFGNIFYGVLVWNSDFHYLKLSLDPLTIEFIAGCIVAKMTYHNHKIHRYKIYPEIIFLSGLVFLIAGIMIYNKTGDSRIARAVLFSIPFSAVLYGSVAMERNGSVIFPRFLRKIGDASYSIYLSHVLVILAIGRIWRPFNIQGYAADNVVFNTIILIMVISFGLCSYRFIERPILLFFRKKN
jgi:exopolysaccharide production protein ExoZ